MNFSDIVKTALDIKMMTDELKSSSYTVASYESNGEVTHHFVASFNIDKLKFEYNVTDLKFIAIRSIDQLEPKVLIAYSKFIESMELYMQGNSHPYVGSIPENFLADSPNMKPSTGFASDHDIDDSEFGLKVHDHAVQRYNKEQEE
jgi:hypothetical protein